MQSRDTEEITPGQVRAARAFLRWSAHDLAEAASLGIATIRRAEGQEDRLGVTAANAKALRSALEAQGIEFIGGEDPGVRLRRGALMAG
ncbi:transcriptional regulator [Methylobacterium sp. NMS14P]|nr:transcriptional regulator [Methylobacterium sp. NMS14P]WCS28326.1 transcriptional regulator [Methylobacterium sp. NMS14P]